MRGRPYRLFIEDIEEALHKIADYEADKDFPGLAEDSLVVDAALGNLQVIGEAAGKIPGEVRDG